MLAVLSANVMFKYKWFQPNVLLWNHNTEYKKASMNGMALTKCELYVQKRTTCSRSSAGVNGVVLHSAKTIVSNAVQP